MDEHQVSNPPQSRSTAWIGAAVLIGLGLIFLIRTLTGFELHNWWALFLLIPTITNWTRAWEHYRRDGRVTRSVANPLFGGLITALLAVAFLIDVNFNWNVVWPIILILIGLREGLFPRQIQEDPLLREPARAALRHPAGYWIARKSAGGSSTFCSPVTLAPMEKYG